MSALIGLAMIWGNTEGIADPGRGHIALWIALAITAAQLAFAAAYLRRYGRAGLYISPDGLRIATPARTTRVPWAEIDHLAVEPGGSDTVYAVVHRRTGPPVRVWAVQGRYAGGRAAVQRAVDRVNLLLANRRPRPSR